jgi:beta-phosphoglucomutase-like phosphatase (HAD superfamily)
MTRNKTAFLFDLDGTLIDSVYQHVLAWKSSLDQEGIPLSVWRIHRKIGMSGGLFANILLRETGFDNTPERFGSMRIRPIYSGISTKSPRAAEKRALAHGPARGHDRSGHDGGE